MATTTITTTQNIELEYELASLGDRLLGGMLDLLIIIGYLFIFNLVFASTGFYNRGNTWIIVIFYLPVTFYSLFSEIFMNGQSVGKRVMGIKVISITGAQPHIGQYLIRWLFRLLDLWYTFFVLGLITIAASGKHQRLGDIIAGTAVVRIRPRTNINQTMYVPVEETAYQATYPEVINLSDSDIQLIKEVIINVQQNQNLVLAWQAKDKVEEVLQIKSKHDEPLNFLYAILMDYNHLAAKL